MSEDPNTEAARVIRETTGEADSLSADLEAAWEAWSSGIQQVDRRVRGLLRAAFEAGAEAAFSSAASEMGRKGGEKGGKARAEKLTPKERKRIAQKAAKKRWSGED
jgi:general stress protein YciG